jgi:tetratricopeptide (TPR) repeat protein
VNGSTGTCRKITAIVIAAGLMVLMAGVPVRAAGEAERCEGSVVDDQGNPLAGVTITFKETQRNREAQPVKTSKKGKWAHNVLEVNQWEIRATLEGYRIVKITALTMRATGDKATDDSYMVGYDQKGLHKVSVVPQSRNDPASKGKCVVDFVMASEATFNDVFHKMREEKLVQEGKPSGDAAPAAGAAGGVPGTPAPAAPASASADVVDICASAYATRDYAGAVEPCRKAVTDKPENAAAHRYLGSALLQQDNVTEAEPELKKALELDPTVAGGHFDMGMLFVKKGRLMQAIPHLEKELESNPQSETILQNLAKIYFDTQQYDKAIATSEQLITLVPDKLENYAMMADAYKQMGNPDKEMEVYSRMGAQDPSGKAFYNLGNIMFNKNEMDKAADAYRRAIQQAPDNADAHYQLGMSLVNLGKFKDAVAELETFIKLKPQDKRAAEAKSMAAELKKMAG